MLSLLMVEPSTLMSALMTAVQMQRTSGLLGAGLQKAKVHWGHSFKMQPTCTRLRWGDVGCTLSHSNQFIVVYIC